MQGKSITRLKGMRMMLDARRRATIAAALAGKPVPCSSCSEVTPCCPEV